MPRFLVFLALMALACSSGPSLPSIAGSYAGTASLVFSNQVHTLSDVTGVNLTINEANDDGHFTGSYFFGGTDSGPFAGDLDEDGAIVITQWGSGSSGASAVQAVFYWCDVDQAAGSGLTGHLQAQGLSLSGSFSMPCHYINPTATYSSTVTLSINVDR